MKIDSDRPSDNRRLQWFDHGEWLAMLLEREATMRRQKRSEARARAAKLRHDAQIENADFRAARGLDRNLFMALATFVSRTILPDAAQLPRRINSCIIVDDCPSLDAWGDIIGPRSTLL